MMNFLITINHDGIITTTDFIGSIKDCMLYLGALIKGHPEYTYSIKVIQ